MCSNKENKKRSIRGHHLQNYLEADLNNFCCFMTPVDRKPGTFIAEKNLPCPKGKLGKNFIELEWSRRLKSVL